MVYLIRSITVKTKELKKLMLGFCGHSACECMLISTGVCLQFCLQFYPFFLKIRLAGSCLNLTNKKLHPHLLWLYFHLEQEMTYQEYSTGEG